jgi:hypothetical protein
VPSKPPRFLSTSISIQFQYQPDPKRRPLDQAEHKIPQVLEHPMSDFLPEAVKSIVEEWIEWANAPKETEELFRLFGSPNEKVLFTCRAGYINSQKNLDRPAGTLLITSSRILFLAKNNNNFMCRTKWVKIPIKSIEDLTCVKYRAAYKIVITSGVREYWFMLQNQLWFKSKEEHEAVAKIIADAYEALEAV